VGVLLKAKVPGASDRTRLERIAGLLRLCAYDFARHAGSSDWVDYAMVVANCEETLPR